VSTPRSVSAPSACTSSTGRLLAGVNDATAGGIDGVALGCLSAREAGESVLELREVMSRRKGLELAILARADQQGVHAQVEGPAATDTAGWLAGRGLLAGRAARAAAKTWFTTWDDGDGTTHLNAKIPTPHADMLRKARHAITNPKLTEAVARTVGAADPQTGETPEAPKPGPRVMGEAFCRLIETLEVDRLPHSGGLNAAVVVTIALQTLHGGLATATMDTGTPSPPARPAAWPATPASTPAVLGSQSEPLDYGRTHRLFSARPTRRDGHAAEVPLRRRGLRPTPRLGRRPPPPPWSRGGRTDLDDGVLICGAHHRLAHHPDYQVTRQPDWRITLTRTPGDTPRRQ
jgi:hypothetical protein